MLPSFSIPAPTSNWIFLFSKLELFVDSRTVMAILGKLHSVHVSMFFIFVLVFFCWPYFFQLGRASRYGRWCDWWSEAIVNFTLSAFTSTQHVCLVCMNLQSTLDWHFTNLLLKNESRPHWLTKSCFLWICSNGGCFFFTCIKCCLWSSDFSSVLVSRTYRPLFLLQHRLKKQARLVPFFVDFYRGCGHSTELHKRRQLDYCCVWEIRVSKEEL